MAFSKYKSKSEMNETLAKSLHDSSSFLPVGHCAYYACFQRICHICYYDIGKTKDQIAS